jgi:hypothetical protein
MFESGWIGGSICKITVNIFVHNHKSKVSDSKCVPKRISSARKNGIVELLSEEI